jgi:hypothetical protein
MTIVGILIFVCGFVYVTRKIRKSRGLEREIKQFIHKSIDADCIGAKAVPIGVLTDKFSTRPGWDAMIKFLTESVIRDIDFYNDSFISLSPKFPMRCRFHGLRWFRILWMCTATVTGMGIVFLVIYACSSRR